MPLLKFRKATSPVSGKWALSPFTESSAVAENRPPRLRNHHFLADLLTVSGRPSITARPPVTHLDDATRYRSFLYQRTIAHLPSTGHVVGLTSLEAPVHRGSLPKKPFIPPGKRTLFNPSGTRTSIKEEFGIAEQFCSDIISAFWSATTGEKCDRKTFQKPAGLRMPEHRLAGSVGGKTSGGTKIAKLNFPGNW